MEEVASSLLQVSLPDFPTPRTPNTLNQQRQLQAWKDQGPLIHPGPGTAAGIGGRGEVCQRHF